MQGEVGLTVVEAEAVAAGLTVVVGGAVSLALVTAGVG